MTAPFAVSGAGYVPAAAGSDVMAASPAYVAAPAESGVMVQAADDPTVARFANFLAKAVGEREASDAAATDRNDAMIADALASLKAAIAEADKAKDAGHAAIRALIDQVAQQGVNAPATVPVADAMAQALAAAAAIAPPMTAPQTAAPATDAHAKVNTEDDAQTARPDGNTDGAPTAANTAANSDTSTAATVTTIDPSLVIRDANALDPAFRAKLDRVIQRMQDEFGYKVTLVETTRTQARQDALYEQGRTTPGQVVTWTRASRHAEGLAADVMIDGGYDNVTAFQRLQRIANEEGLHTLGSRDLGHLELRTPEPGGFTTKIGAIAAEKPVLHPGKPVVNMATVTNPARHDAMARIARVAHVASVAATAQVARVASVARVAAAGASAAATAVATAKATETATATAAASVEQTAATTASAAATASADAASKAQAMKTDDAAATKAVNTKAATAAAAGTASTVAAAGQHAARDRARDDGARTPRKQVEAAAAVNDPAPLPFVAAPRGAAAALASVQGIAGPDQTARVDQIDAMHAKAAAQPVSSMVLNVDDGNGGTDRIRVDVRGNAVGSTIDVRDSQTATQLQDRTAELTRALESHGLESEGVRVRAVGPTASTEALRATSGGEAVAARGMNAALAADASTPSRRERDDARDPRAPWNQQEPESQRQRARKDREEQPQ